MTKTPIVMALAVAVCAALVAPAAAGSPGTPDRVDAEMGPLELVQVRRSGEPSFGNAVGASISANGRYVVYTSRFLRVVGMERSEWNQILRYDRKTRESVLVSVTPDGEAGGDHSFDAAMSADGRVVVFSTNAGDLLPGSPPLGPSVVVARDIDTGETSLVSQTPEGNFPDGGSYEPMVSDDGSLVIFVASSADIAGVAGAVVHDRTTGTTTAVTVDAGAETITPDTAWLSGDGEWVLFDSDDNRIVPGDDNARTDVFLMRLETGAVTLVSRAADGSVADRGGRLSDGRIQPDSDQKPLLSSDGSRMVFLSTSTDLAGSEGTATDPVTSQIYAFDTGAAESELVSAMPDGSSAVDPHLMASISPDGRYVAFPSQAFVAGGGGAPGLKVFLRDLERDKTRAASSNQSATNPGVGGTHPRVVFISDHGLVPEDTDGKVDPYLRRVW